jgi:hypothetical protein
MNTTTAATVPAVTSQIADLMDDLTGFHQALDRIVAAFGELLTADLDADQSQTAIAVLGGLADGHLATLLGLTLRKIASPDTNPALADLTDDRKQTLRRLGAEYAAAIADDYTTRVAAEASAAIDGS